MFQACLKVRLLADFLEERQSHGGVVDGHVTRPEHGATCAGVVSSAQADREKTQRAARALEVRDRRPALAHEVNQRGMEWIGGADAVAQFNAFLFGLLLLRWGFGVGSTHGGNDFLKCGGGGSAVSVGRHFAKQTALDDAQNFVASRPARGAGLCARQDGRPFAAD